MSSFQLPYYLNIIFPFFAILTAVYVYRLKTEKGYRFFSITQYSLMVIMLLVMVVVQYFFRPEQQSTWLWVLVGILAVLFFLLRPGVTNNRKSVVFWRNCMISFLVNAYFIVIFYPSLLVYQAGSEAAFYINEKIPEEEQVLLYNWNDIALELYLDRALQRHDLFTTLVKSKGDQLLVFTDEEGYETLKEMAFQTEVVKAFDYYRITMLTPKFINHRTRDQNLEKRLLLRVYWPEGG